MSSSPTTIHLSRHGETDWNRSLRWQGHTNIPLNALGLQQAAALAARLRAEAIRPQLVVSSDLDRLLTVTDRVGMMYRGQLIFDGTTSEAQNSAQPMVKQFVHGLTEGPL